MLANKLLAASGGVDTLYVDDVFSAFTYTGNGTTQTINNGIDLAGKGGLVWVKSRVSTGNHGLVDDARGVRSYLLSDLADAAYSNVLGCDVTAFNTNGFMLGPSQRISSNTSAQTYVAWTFRKAPKFFDIVTYTGNGASNRAIPHTLGIAPGMLWSKSTSTAGNWNVYHRSATGDLVLNSTAAQTGSRAIMVAASDTTFTVSGVANTNGVTYVAHLYAHDPSAEGIIQCGSYAGLVPTVTLGWEPQFIMFKCLNLHSTDWFMLDASRGITTNSFDNSEQVLRANLSNAEGAWSILSPLSTGFKLDAGGNYVGGDVSGTGNTYIYMAIRRPNKPPTLGTEVYNAIARTGTGAVATVTGVGFAPDTCLISARALSGKGFCSFWDRLRGAPRHIRPYQTSPESTGTDELSSFNMDGFSTGTSTSGGFTNRATTYINHFFKRAPGVFDVVCYTGTGVTNYVAHSLGVPPEFMIVKNRSNTADWFTVAQTWRGFLNTTAAMTNDGWPSNAVNIGFGNAPTTNALGNTYVVYIFASKAGISKVGSYTGNGSSQTINADFTTGARFILIKRTDAVGDWYVWDTVRGIVAGNDPHLSLNTMAAEVTSNDSIDPHTSGFIVNQVAATNINVSGGSYIYLSFA